MNDKELADRIVALGVGEFVSDNIFPPGEYYLSKKAANYGVTGLTSEVFVRDWRVAGALMEKMNLDELRYEIDWQGVEWLTDPRAICEACVEALTND